ncbi:response regulator [Patulibacter sp.]|uniref:response regulator n=1 Tax=Patulibacter sp. TaxID=1912859 RepID=UPI002727577E|nr:response regulator [Patulibacter sp.]MDO9408161.1 response regulator [Patulibacter sp.]
MARVLVVEDALEVLDLVVARLRRGGHEVRCSPADPPVAARRSQAFSPEVCVVDVALPEGAGLRALQALRAADADVRLIACTAAGVDVNVISAIRSGATEVVSTLHGLEVALGQSPRPHGRPHPRRLLSS